MLLCLAIVALDCKAAFAGASLGRCLAAVLLAALPILFFSVVLQRACWHAFAGMLVVKYCAALLPNRVIGGQEAWAELWLLARNN
jgi:hypothetical protein